MNEIIPRLFNEHGLVASFALAVAGTVGADPERVHERPASRISRSSPVWA